MSLFLISNGIRPLLPSSLCLLRLRIGFTSFIMSHAFFVEGLGGAFYLFSANSKVKLFENYK